MILNGIKDLEKVMKLCRKQGVRSMKIDGLEFTLEDVSYQIKSEISKPVSNIPGLPESIPSAMPTAEQLLFGSSDPTVWQNQGNG